MLRTAGGWGTRRLCPVLRTAGGWGTRRLRTKQGLREAWKTPFGSSLVLNVTLKNIYLFIYLATLGLSCSMQGLCWGVRTPGCSM